MPDKKLELFKQIVPQLRRVLVLQDPNDPLTSQLLPKVRQAGVALNLDLVGQSVTDEADIKRVFGAMHGGDMDGVFVVSPTLQVKFSSLLIRLVAEKALPLPGYRKAWVEKAIILRWYERILTEHARL